jgi:thiamine-monophosphate kinase
MMNVRDLGEFELIDMLAKSIALSNRQNVQALEDSGLRMLRSIGDDAAAWHSAEGVRVFTSDTMVEGVHFDLSYTGWGDLGWKALATNVSDVAAMGCAPSFATVTLGLRGDIPVEGLLEMYDGMMSLTEICGGAVVGGDIVKSPTFFISVALEGVARSDDRELLLRDKAQPGDCIAVTGNLGSSAAGLKLMMEGADEAGIASYGFFRDAHNRPMPRVSEGESLANIGVRCAMDISDGLVDDLGKLCRASRVGAQIHTPMIPVEDRLKAIFPSSWLNLALSGGEDYELLIAARESVIRSAQGVISTPIAIIGEIVEADAGLTVLDAGGKPLNISAGGWDHFRGS